MSTYDTKTPAADGDESEPPMARLFSLEAANDPHPAYARLRSECPVLRGEGWDGHPQVLISSYEHVCDALRAPEVFSSSPDAINIGQEQKLIPLQVDPPEHAKYRRFLDPLFGPKRMQALEPDARKLVNELIDKFESRGHCDAHGEFAEPLPSGMFLALMGLPMDDLPKFLQWRDDTIRPDVPPGDMEAAAKVRDRAGHEINEYFKAMMAERRRNPDESLMSTVAHGEVDGRPMTDEETLGTLHLLLLGGLDTVTATLDCTLAFLAQHPEYRQRLIDNPDLAPAAVEEMLRHQSPVMMVVRVVKEDAELGGVELKEGDHVSVLIGGANSDTEEFDKADEVIFDREANRHLAFGAGPHRCLGSNLARVELQVALAEWHRRIPDYRLADGAELSFSPGIRQTTPLPLVWS